MHHIVFTSLEEKTLIYIYRYIDMYIYTHLHICVYIYTQVCVYIYVYIHTSVYIHRIYIYEYTEYMHTHFAQICLQNM